MQEKILRSLFREANNACQRLGVLITSLSIVLTLFLDEVSLKTGILAIVVGILTTFTCLYNKIKLDIEEKTK